MGSAPPSGSVDTGTDARSTGAMPGSRLDVPNRSGTRAVCALRPHVRHRQHIDAVDDAVQLWIEADYTDI